MKIESMLKLIELPEGVTIDLKPLEDEWNRQYNGMVKTVREETTTKAVSDLLGKYKLEKEEDIKTLQDANLSNDEKGNEALIKLQGEFETLTTNLKTKDAELLKQTQIGALGKLNIKADKLEKAYKLISSDVNDDNDFATVATKFVTETPEWIGEKGPNVNLGDDKGDGTPPPVGKVDDIW